MRNDAICCCCKNSQWKYLYTSFDHMFNIKGTFRLYSCTKCGLIRIFPLISDNNIKKYYPSGKYYSYQDIQKDNFFKVLRTYLVNHYYEPTVMSKIFSIVVKNVPAIPSYVKKGKILDIGCGWGHTLDLLRKLGWNVYGLEIDAKAVRLARSLGLRQVTLGGYRKLHTYPNSFFDAIRMYHVLEHVDYPDKCVQDIYKKLHSKGELILGVPNRSGFVAKIFGRYWYGLDVPRHRYSFTVPALRSLLERNGFTITSIGYYSAGGFLGSLHNYIFEKRKKHIPLVNNLLLMFLTYPLEWFFDLIRFGDLCVVYARKNT